MTEQPERYRRIDPESYRAERRLLIETEIDQLRSFDKTIVTLSSAALALSLTVIRDSTTKPDPDSLIWLQVTWGAFIFSLCLTLSSFLTGAASIRRVRDCLDRMFATQEEQPEARVLSGLTNALNYGSCGAFIVGTACLAWFVGSNFGS